MNIDKKRIIIAVTGASGSCYARLLAQRLLACGQIGRLALIVTDNGQKVAAYEDGDEWFSSPGIVRYDNHDLFSDPASGSARFDTMVVIPCSMGMLGKIASGVSDDLVSRSADVMLKERRRLILVTRETPLNSIHIANMQTVTAAGAIVCPASPSFYSLPRNIEQVCMSVVERVMSLMDIDDGQYRWKNPGKENRNK